MEQRIYGSNFGLIVGAKFEWSHPLLKCCWIFWDNLGYFTSCEYSLGVKILLEKMSFLEVQGCGFLPFQERWVGWGGWIHLGPACPYWFHRNPKLLPHVHLLEGWNWALLFFPALKIYLFKSLWKAKKLWNHIIYFFS